MRILALAINYQGFTFETLFREQMALKKALEENGHEIIFIGPGFEYYSNDVAKVFNDLSAEGRKPDVLLSYLSENLFEEPLPENVQHRYGLTKDFTRFPVNVDKVTGIPKVMWINDFWHMTQEQWDFALLEHGFKYVLATYSPPFLRVETFEKTYSPEVRKVVSFIPCRRSADPKLFHDYGEGRDIDVCLLGARGPFYDLRGYFHKTLSHQSWINYFTQDHPGYGYGLTNTLTNEAYARVLARSKIFVSCAGRYKLPFIKVSEVLASGALLMCDRPNGAEQLGLVDGQTYVEVDKVNFLQKLQLYLQNPAELKEIAQRGLSLFEERYAVNINGEKIAAVLSEIAGGGFGRVISSDVVAEDSGEIIDIEEKPHVPVANGCGLASGLQTLKNRIFSAFCHGMPPDEGNDEASSLPSPWPYVASHSCLDWKRVVEVKHALDICQIDSIGDLKLIEKYGLNAHWGQKPVITAHPEIVSIRPKVLKLLAKAAGIKSFCEIGTARGLQSIFWASYLKEEGIKDGLIYTCDINGHDTPIYRTPLDGDALFTRRELWQQTEVTSEIKFFHGVSHSLAEHMDKVLGGRFIEMAYIDAVHNEENVLNDFENLRRHLSPAAILVFDDCDPRFPGVERAVNKIAEEMNLDIRLVSFWPNPYLVAVLGSHISLKQLRGCKTVE